MEPIKALSLLGISGNDIDRYAIRLNNVMAHYNPWTSPVDNMFDHLFGCRWTKDQKRRMIRGDYVLQFLQLNAGSPSFVFMGCYVVDKEPVAKAHIELPTGDTFPGFEYFEWRDREVERFKPYARRLIVRFVRKPGFKFQRMDFNLANDSYAAEFLENMTVETIRPTPYEFQPFPGYANVRLTHPELVRAVNDEGWRVALGNVKAVYLQTDRSNGWHYVGSAYGENGETAGLLSRWEDYAGGDHTGNNALLQAIPDAKEHIERYFQYSILDVFDMKTDKDDIIAREQWWKDTLSSKRCGEKSALEKEQPHGYNDN